MEKILMFQDSSVVAVNFSIFIKAPKEAGLYQNLSLPPWIRSIWPSIPD